MQSCFGNVRNRRLRTRGPTWQGRYQAKLVQDEHYLQQLVAYIHLNPVAAKLVKDPGKYRWNGHRELIGSWNEPSIIDVDRTLSLYGTTEQDARHSYLESLKPDDPLVASWLGEAPGQLPWWPRKASRKIEVEVRPGSVALGRSTGIVRGSVSACRFLEAACRILDFKTTVLASGARTPANTRIWWLVAGVAAERWRVGTKVMAMYLGRKPSVVTSWIARSAWEKTQKYRAKHVFTRRLQVPQGPQTWHAPVSTIVFLRSCVIL